MHAWDDSVKYAWSGHSQVFFQGTQPLVGHEFIHFCSPHFQLSLPTLHPSVFPASSNHTSFAQRAQGALFADAVYRPPTLITHSIKKTLELIFSISPLSCFSLPFHFLWLHWTMAPPRGRPSIWTDAIHGLSAPASFLCFITSNGEVMFGQRLSADSRMNKAWMDFDKIFSWVDVRNTSVSEKQTHGGGPIRLQRVWGFPTGCRDRNSSVQEPRQKTSRTSISVLLILLITDSLSEDVTVSPKQCQKCLSVVASNARSCRWKVSFKCNKAEQKERVPIILCAQLTTDLVAEPKWQQVAKESRVTKFIKLHRVSNLTCGSV